MAAAQNGVYWIGADGNVYASGPTTGGVINYGRANSPDLDFNTLNSFARIDDPNPPTQSSTSTATTGGGGSGSSFIDTSGARAATQSSIDSLDQILANKLAQAQAEYDALIGQYQTEAGENKAAYDKQVVGNESNRESQNQAALLAAANGSRGLNSVLASIGALGGTGKLLANRAVANEANIDIGEADKTFSTNASNLFDSYGKLKKQETQREMDAKSTFEKTQQQQKYDITANRQQLWKDMADLWTKAGNNAEANNAMARAATLNSELVNNTRPNVPGYAKTPLQYSAPALESYLAGANDMTVSTGASGGLPINGAIYTSTRKREKQVV